MKVIQAFRKAWCVYMAVGLLVAFVASVILGVSLSEETVESIMSWLPSKVLLIPASFCFLSVPFFFAWSLLYRPEVSRFVRSGRVAILVLAGAYAGAFGFILPKSIEYATTKRGEEGRVVVLLEKFADSAQPWAYLSMLLIASAAVGAFTFLYYIVAKDERDNGALPHGFYGK